MFFIFGGYKILWYKVIYPQKGTMFTTGVSVLKEEAIASSDENNEI